MLKVSPLLPVADAAILPLLCPGPDVLVTVAVTFIVTPLHGLAGASPPPLLLHEM